MFINITVDNSRANFVDCDEARINTDQITWIDIKDKSIRFTDGSFLYLSSAELNKVIMATTEKIVILKDAFGPFTDV